MPSIPAVGTRPISPSTRVEIVPRPSQFAGLQAALDKSDLAAVSSELTFINLRIVTGPFTPKDAEELVPLLDRAVFLAQHADDKTTGRKILDVILAIITLGILPLIRALRPKTVSNVAEIANECRTKAAPLKAWPALEAPRTPVKLHQSGAADLGNDTFVLPNGVLSLAPTRASNAPDHLAVYSAARLVADDRSLLSELASPTRKKLAEHVIAAHDAGVGDSAPSLELRSGSATLLLALAETAAASGDTAQAKALLSRYLQWCEAEPHKGLRTSMILNLDRRASALGLSAAQKAALERLKTEALPTKPPYDEWFKDGKKELHIRHYMHEEFFDLEPYTRRGFKVTDKGNGFYDLEGKIGDVTVKVYLQKVQGYSSDSQMLSQLDNPDYQVIIYSGHSNLGGNIAMAMAAAPKEQAGTKLVALEMCRGQQNTAEFVNRYPNTHFITTAEPMHQWGMNDVTSAILETVEKRAGYDFMGVKAGNDGSPYMPNDPHAYAYKDEDRDGRPDGDVDSLYDVRARTLLSTDDGFSPAATAPDVSTIDASAMTNAVAFARTMLTYHGEHDYESPMPESTGEALVANGFYTPAPGDETFVRITPEIVDGKKRYKLQINARYAHMSEGALAMRLLYELNHYFSEQAGHYDLQDKTRGLMLAAEWMAYMTFPGERRRELIEGLARAYGWPVGADGMSYELISSIENDYGNTSGAKKLLTPERRLRWQGLKIR